MHSFFFNFYIPILMHSFFSHSSKRGGGGYQGVLIFFYIPRKKRGGVLGVLIFFKVSGRDVI